MLAALVVEDLKEDRLVIKQKLNFDYPVTTLSSAIDARAFALTHRFDIALLNVRLCNHLDCVELLKDLKQIAENNFITIAITCHVDDVGLQWLMQAGFKGVLKKPLNKVEFDRLVNLDFSKITD